MLWAVVDRDLVVMEEGAPLAEALATWSRWTAWFPEDGPFYLKELGEETPCLQPSPDSVKPAPQLLLPEQSGAS